MKRKDLLVLLIPSFIIIMLWVIFNIYHNYISSTIPESLNTQIIQIDPTFDTKTIDGLKKREMVTPLDSFESKQIVPNPTSTPIQTPIATPTSALNNSSNKILPSSKTVSNL